MKERYWQVSWAGAGDFPPLDAPLMAVLEGAVSLTSASRSTSACSSSRML
jgi:hypothetical protein